MTLLVLFTCFNLSLPPLWHTCTHVLHEKTHKTFKLTLQMQQKYTTDFEIEDLPLSIKCNLRASYYIVPNTVKIYVGEQIPQLATFKPSIIYAGFQMNISLIR